MTKIIDGIRVFTYDEWSKLPEVMEMFEKLDDCRECAGEGTHECSCGDKHECYRCKGSGKRQSLADIYRDTLQIETKKIADWNAGKPIVIIEKRRRDSKMNKCWSCRKALKGTEGNYRCYGCNHYVCMLCSEKYGHFSGGQHGRRPRKSSAIGTKANRKQAR